MHCTLCQNFVDVGIVQIRILLPEEVVLEVFSENGSYLLILNEHFIFIRMSTHYEIVTKCAENTRINK